MFKNDDKNIMRYSDRVNEMFKNLSKSKNLKNEKFRNLTYIEAIRKSIFLIVNVKKTFNYLKQAFY